MWKKRIGWGVWLIAAALLYFFENNTGTRILLVTALVLPLLSVLCATAAAKSARITLAVPESCEKGGKALCALQLSGNYTLLGATAVCAVAAENQLTGEHSVCSLTISGMGGRKKSMPSPQPTAELSACGWSAPCCRTGLVCGLPDR